MRKATPIIILLLLILPSFAFSDDGTYDATVTTDSGSYFVSAEVEVTFSLKNVPFPG